jgi:phospholipase C
MQKQARPAIAALIVLGAACGDNDPALIIGPGEDGFAAGDDFGARRAACAYHAGALPAESIGPTDALPITHVVVVVQENHSFDSYFAGLKTSGMQPDIDVFPDGFANVDANGVVVTPHPTTSSCLNMDPPHQWQDAHLAWQNGRQNGFARNGGSDALTYFDGSLMPFYYWLASTFAMSDRHFAPVLAGTWANRDYLYAGTSRGVEDSFSRPIPDTRTIFDALDEAGVSWGVFTDGEPFQDTLGWNRTHGGVYMFDQYVTMAADGTLPAVSFVDPPAFSDEDEHPSGVADLSKGQGWSRSVYQAAVASPLWPSMALFLTWDEWGGFFDHVPPPAACPPSADQPLFNRLGFRIGLLVASPWVKPHFVSHLHHSHTSITRFIELAYGLPALTDRDANSDALLDLFDFTTPAMMSPPPAPEVAIPSCQ